MKAKRKQEKSPWDELVWAIKKTFADSSLYSREIKIRFGRHESTRHTSNYSNVDQISIFIDDEDVGNCYDRKTGWLWEIYLNKDGTWEIQ